MRCWAQLFPLCSLPEGPQIKCIAYAVPPLLFCHTDDSSLCRHSQADWDVMLPALLAGCSLDAAAAWLGYVPSALQEDADALLQQMQAGVPSLLAVSVSMT